MFSFLVEITYIYLYYQSNGNYESLRNTILRMQASNQSNNFRPGGENYAYYNQKAKIYFKR